MVVAALKLWIRGRRNQFIIYSISDNSSCSSSQICYNQHRKKVVESTTTLCRIVKKLMVCITYLIRPTRKKVRTDFFVIIFDNVIAKTNQGNMRLPNVSLIR